MFSTEYCEGMHVGNSSVYPCKTTDNSQLRHSTHTNIQYPSALCQPVHASSVTGGHETAHLFHSGHRQGHGHKVCAFSRKQILHHLSTPSITSEDRIIALHACTWLHMSACVCSGLHGGERGIHPLEHLCPPFKMPTKYYVWQFTRSPYLDNCKFTKGWGLFESWKLRG